jgi:hypothetical protein
LRYISRDAGLLSEVRGNALKDNPRKDTSSGRNRVCHPVSSLITANGCALSVPRQKADHFVKTGNRILKEVQP